jgi:signal peptidase II
MAGAIRLWGVRSGLGLLAALIVLVIDQAHKYWMLGPFDIAGRGRVELAPFLDLVMVWNRGISYGLLQQDGTLGRYLLIAVTVLAICVLVLWLATTAGRLTAIAFGLIIGGALSNLIDRLLHGAVADFFLLHAWGFEWYVFNIADMAIVAGVVWLLYDSVLGRHKSAANGH